MRHLKTLARTPAPSIHTMIIRSHTYVAREVLRCPLEDHLTVRQDMHTCR
jgi:hypothetical protein